MLQFDEKELQEVVNAIIKKENEFPISKTVEERKDFLYDIIVGNFLDEELVFQLRCKLIELVLQK